MRSIVLALVPALFVLAACDKDEKAKEVGGASTATASAPAASATPTTSPPKDAGAPAASVAMPERPVPKPQTMVSASAPEEVQMKAIGYMVAMRAPRPDDAPADDAYAADLVTRLKPVVLAMDKGGDKAKWNRVEMVAKGRQIDLYMSEGCDAKAPFNAVVQRLNTPLATLLSHGVLVVRCNDKRQQCLQSARDPDDVLCTTAPRHR
jgi:hypothetical protein